ncbi:AAC(3)-I family aminoglycoside N-acetyltransferase [Aurantimonas sp. A2-1-M11]|uniref:AAC(3)-I family aminoglycoside N-acetyltransferase n=1 Tax=Aurantimonas sp. A2-1-M11 TaxID=3113712 RepID=UPI002F93978C
MTTIHLLTPDDLPTMRTMLALFGKVFDEPDTYGASPPSDEWLAQLLARDTFVALAAIRDGAVVGGLAGYILPKYEQARSEGYIYDLAVDAAHRRQGIATRLIAAMTREAKARGAWVVFVQADRGDDPAIALYTGLGQREDVLHFDIPVG